MISRKSIIYLFCFTVVAIISQWRGITAYYLTHTGVKELSIVKLELAMQYLSSESQKEQVLFYEALVYARLGEYSRGELLIGNTIARSTSLSIKASGYELLGDIKSLQAESQNKKDIQMIQYTQALSFYDASVKLLPNPRIQVKIEIIRSLLDTVLASQYQESPSGTGSNGRNNQTNTLSKEEKTTIQEARTILNQYQKERQKFVRLVGDTTPDEAIQDLWGSLLENTEKKVKEDW